MRHTRESVLALIDECREKGTRIDLSGQDLQETDLRWFDLRWADLKETDLRGTDLRWSDLRWSDLRRSDLRWSDLRRSDLRGANMRWADLQEADFDFAGYELSCKTTDVKVGRRLVSQLLYHMCRMDVQDCPEWDELRNDERVIALANQSHVIPVHGLPEIKPLKEQELEEIE